MAPQKHQLVIYLLFLTSFYEQNLLNSICSYYLIFLVTLFVLLLMMSKPFTYVTGHCVSFTVSLTSSWTAFSFLPTIPLSVSLPSHYCAIRTAHFQEPSGSSSSAGVGRGVRAEDSGRVQLPRQPTVQVLLFASSLSWLVPLHNSIYLCLLCFPICKITTGDWGNKGTEMKTNY